MIWTIVMISLQRLWNNKLELLLIFVVPVIFFSIFALIFSQGIADQTAAIHVAVIDDDRTALTEEIIDFLSEQSALETDERVLTSSLDWSVDTLAKTIMNVRDADVVIHIPVEFTKNMKNLKQTEIQLLSKGTNPVAMQIVNMILKQIITATRTRYLTLHHHARRVKMAALEIGSANTDQESEPSPEPVKLSDDEMQNFLTIKTTELFALQKQNPKIVMYAAGIAVMFLLFSATAAGGSLLEENEAGTLDRLLSSRLSISQLLAGKWIYITLLGCLQLVIMFTWAQVAFGVDFIGHLAGFTVMTIATSAATSSLGLLLASVSRTRAHLNAISLVIILSMSALGGSMIPRYIMSETMQRWGYVTFNAWALDGFQKVFWYDLPVSSLSNEIAMMTIMTITLAILARLFAERWASK